MAVRTVADGNLVCGFDRRGLFRLDEFDLDPCVRDRREELPGKPDNLVLTGVWSFTHTGGPSGLEPTEAELIPPSG